MPQASKDLALYQEQTSDNIWYDGSRKRYFASLTFRPRFIKLDSNAYLERYTATKALDGDGRDGWVTIPLSAGTVPIPQRRIEPSVLRTLLECIRETWSVEILYQSMSVARPKPLWRRVSPHAFGFDGLRWHTRAYCHIEGKFKDFILSRCLDARAPGESGASPSQDQFWTRHFSVSLCPNPRLSPSQQEVVAQDFTMENRRLIVPVRCAMLYYFSKRLRLDVSERFDDPHEAPIVVKNRDAFDAALAEAMR